MNEHVTIDTSLETQGGTFFPLLTRMLVILARPSKVGAEGTLETNDCVWGYVETRQLCFG